MNIHGINSVGTLNQETGGYATLSGSFTGSFKGDGSQLTNLPQTNTGSLLTTASFNAYTQSNDQRVSSLETNSASVNISINAINSVSNSWITESETSSFARTNVDNNFSANQTFTNISATSASIRYLTVLYETASVIYSTGSNQLGDELTDIQTLSGSVKVQGSLTINGTSVQTSSFDASALNQATESLQSFTQSAQISINALNTNSASVNTSITNLNQFTASQSTASLVTSITELNTFSASAKISISNLNTTTASLNSSVTQLNASSASQQISIDNLNAATSSYITNAQTASMSVATASVALAVSTSISTQNLQHFVTFVDNSTGTQAIYVDGGIKYNPNQDLLVVNNITSSGYISGSSLNLTSTLTASLANGYVWVGNGSNVSTLVATSSFATNVSNLATTGSNSFNGNQTITGSLILSSSNAVELTVIGNMVVTGSAFGNVVALSITSNTASMDLSLGNYFTLTLAGTATTHISASNVQPGLSATLVITTGTNSSASLAPTMLQPSGSAYSATNGSSNKDVLSIVAVTTGVPFVVSTKNMI